MSRALFSPSRRSLDRCEQCQAERRRSPFGSSAECCPRPHWWPMFNCCRPGLNSTSRAGLVRAGLRVAGHRNCVSAVDISECHIGGAHLVHDDFARRARATLASRPLPQTARVEHGMSGLGRRADAHCRSSVRLTLCGLLERVCSSSHVR